jgi:endonuclease/exonuclease/phosphatase family metal-dependent hydrolase
MITLNVRRDEQDDGINNWQFRRDLIAAIVRRYDPDIAAFQEVLVHQLRDLQEMLPGYRYVGVGRDDGHEAGEFAPIFHRDLPVDRHGTFWLSDTPERPSRTWPGLSRICTWAAFSGARPFAVFNCHLEHQFDETRLNSVALLAAKTGEFPERLPVFLIGDFNLTPRSAPYAALTEVFRDCFVAQGDDTAVTFHNWTGRTVAAHGRSGRIDYVWQRSNLANVKVADCRVLTDNPATQPGVYPSDHWPVLCDVDLR